MTDDLDRDPETMLDDPSATNMEKAVALLESYGVMQAIEKAEDDAEQRGLCLHCFDRAVAHLAGGYLGSVMFQGVDEGRWSAEDVEKASQEFTEIFIAALFAYLQDMGRTIQ